MAIRTLEEFENHRPAPVPSAEFRSRFGALTLADLGKPGPEYEHLVKGILTRGETSMLVGPSGSGKSFLATHIGLCIARGADFMKVSSGGGREVAPKVRKGGVLYIAGEGARGLKKRLRAYLKHWGVDPSDVPFVLLTLPVDLHGSDEPTQYLIQEAVHYSQKFQAEHGVPIELVVIDTLSASSPGANENTSEDVSRILGRCNRVREALNAAVMLVHHMNADGTKARGHTSLGANVDSVIEVKKTELKDRHQPSGRLIRTAKITKQKDGDSDISWRFVLPSVELGLDADGDPITSCVVEPPDLGGDDAQEEPNGAFILKTDNAKLSLQCLIEALKTKGGRAPSGITAPPGRLVVHRRHWNDVLRRRGAAGHDDDPEKLKARLKKLNQRSLEAFQNWNLIMVDGDYVWLTGRPVRGFNVENIAGPTTLAEAANFDDQDTADLLGGT